MSAILESSADLIKSVVQLLAELKSCRCSLVFIGIVSNEEQFNGRTLDAFFMALCKS
jgi:hypothetical protein